MSSRVLLPGKVDDRALAAFYRTAHLYWSMSEHEGFGVPLVEAMWYDMPELADKSAAVPETLGAAGTLFTSKEDHRQVAALAYLLVHERDLRRKMLAAQRERRAAFTRALRGGVRAPARRPERPVAHRMNPQARQRPAISITSAPCAGQRVGRDIDSKDEPVRQSDQ